MITGWRFMVRFDRKQQNSVRQYSIINNKQILKKKDAEQSRQTIPGVEKNHSSLNGSAEWREELAGPGPLIWGNPPLPSSSQSCFIFLRATLPLVRYSRCVTFYKGNVENTPLHCNTSLPLALLLILFTIDSAPSFKMTNTQCVSMLLLATMSAC